MAEAQNPEVSLSPEQEAVVDCVFEGQNIFMTGPAGVGKSHVIRTIVERAREEGLRVALTASTGVAADLLGGTTIHTQLGLGLAKEPVEQLVNKARRSRKIKAKWSGLHLLVIDEVSMLDPDFFCKLDAILKGIYQSDEPFGGLCLLLSGDFYQLPPVLDRNRDPAAPKFVFQTEAWRNGNITTVELTAIYRQRGDPTLGEVLRRVRTADHTVEDVEVLFSRKGAQLNLPEGIEPTCMYSRKQRVDAINDRKLAELPEDAESQTFTGSSFWQLDTALTRSKRRRTTEPPKPKPEKEQMLREAQAVILRNVPTPTTLQLKVGAQVMLLANLDQENGLVNGSRGVVTEFRDGMPVVKFANCEFPVPPYSWEYVVDGAGIVTYRQTPLRLAWAITIHKAQGLSLDFVEMAVDASVFECGQAYVGLSRVRNLQGLRLTEFKPQYLKAHPLVKQFYNQL